MASIATFKDKLSKRSSEFGKAIGFTFIGIICVSIIILVFVSITKTLYYEKYKIIESFVHDNELVWVWALGLVGIFYAIRATYEASSALEESKKIYTAISAFFDSYDQATGRIETLISEAKNELLILVSLPAYGVIVNKNLGDTFYSALNKRFPDCNTKNLKIEYICFNQPLCSKYEDHFRDENIYDTYMNYKKDILQGIHNIRSLQRKSIDNYENLWLLGMDTHLRLFIADNSRAIFATVPDFKPDAPLEASVAGFETNETKMVEILKKLFEETKRSGSPMSDSEFASFKLNK